MVVEIKIEGQPGPVLTALKLLISVAVGVAIGIAIAVAALPLR